jgi:probable blue pigment (indigoidine) exporter
VKRSLPMILLITSTFLMGSSFVVGKVGLEYFSPLILTAYRFIIGGGLLLAVVLCKSREIPAFTFIWKAALIGALQTSGVMAAIFISMQWISAGEASILTFTNPLFVLIFSSLLLREKYLWRQWLGVMIGIIGVAIVLNVGFQASKGIWIALSAGIFWAFATLLVKQWGAQFDMWLLTAMQMTFGGIILYVLALTVEEIVAVWNMESVTILLWLAIPGSIIQFGLWYLLLSRMDSSKASSFLFLAPFFGVLTEAVWFNQTLGGLKLIGGICVFVGIFLTNYKGRFRPKVKRI